MSNKKTAIIKLLILLIILIIIPVFLYFNYKDTLFNVEWLSDLPAHLSNNKPIACLSLIIIQAFQVIICLIPGQPIQFASSYMFGIVGGYLISIAGALVGAFIAFYLAKWLGSDAVKILFGASKVENYHKKMNSGRGLLIVLIIYLIPGLPKDLVAYVAGISEMRIIPFLVISTIGRTPGMLGSLFIGHYFQAGNYTAIIIVGVICAIILGICWYYRKKIIKLMDDIEAKDIAREEKNHAKTK